MNKYCISLLSVFALSVFSSHADEYELPAHAMEAPVKFDKRRLTHQYESYELNPLTKDAKRIWRSPMTYGEYRENLNKTIEITGAYVRDNQRSLDNEMRDLTHSKGFSVYDDYIIFPAEYIIGFNEEAYKDKVNAELMADIAVNEFVAAQYADIYKNHVGKKFVDDKMKAHANVLIQLASGAKVDESLKSVQQDIVRAISPKDLAKIKEEYEKGKFSSKLKPAVWTLYNYYKKLAEESNIKKEKLDQRVRWYISSYDPELRDYYSNSKKITFYDTIPNFEGLTYLAKNDKARYLKKITYSTVEKTKLESGYEWAQGEDYTEKSENYPIPVSYRKYASHPELRVINDSWQKVETSIWDSKGNLVAVVDVPDKLYIFRDGGYGTSIYEIGSELYKIAWNENKYNIRSRPSQVTHYVKVLAGLEGTTAAEKAKAKAADQKRKQKYINARRHYEKTGRGKRESDWAEVNYFLSPSGGPTYSEEGDNWTNQILNENKATLSQVASVERVDPTSFRVVYLDEDAKPCYELTLKFKADKPYHLGAVERTLKRL